MPVVNLDIAAHGRYRPPVAGADGGAGTGVAVAVFGVADAAAAVLLGGLDFAAAVSVGAVVEIVAAAGVVAGVVIVAAVVVIGVGVDLQVDLGAGFGCCGSAEEGGAEKEQGSHDGSPERWRVETFGLLRA